MLESIDVPQGDHVARTAPITAAVIAKTVMS